MCCLSWRRFVLRSRPGDLYRKARISSGMVSHSFLTSVALQTVRPIAQCLRTDSDDDKVSDVKSSALDRAAKGRGSLAPSVRPVGAATYYANGEPLR